MPAMVTDHAGKNSVNCGKLGPIDDFGGWTIQGRSQIHVQGEGCYGLALYGFAPGLRVAWAAASLAP
jgi:hypothetical protein